MSHNIYELETKESNMVNRYFETASTVMNLANECADEEIANILKKGSFQILELAQTHGALIKTAQIKIDTDSE